MLKRKVTFLSIFAVALAIFVASQSAFALDKFVSYANARFGFSFMRPVSFTALAEPANGDGQVFISKQLKMKITGSGFYNVLEQSALEVAVESVPDGVNYKKLNCRTNSDNDISVTWQDKGYVYLIRVIRTQAKNEQDPERLLSLRIEYPRKNEAKCRKYAERVINSLHEVD